MTQPRHAEHGVVGPTGSVRSGPRGRFQHRRLGAAAVLLTLLTWSLLSMHQPTGTQALFTSRAKPQHSAIQGAVWAPDPPAACGPLSQYAGVVYGTMGDDVLHGGNHPQIIMGLGGNDTIYGGNSGDCLVGGAGDDHLIGGNGKDILLGGPGDDFLDGGNAKDYLDGEDDADQCDGGNGKDDVVNCDVPSPLTLQPKSQQLAPQTSTLSAPEAPPTKTAGSSTEQPGSAGASTDQPVPVETSTAQPDAAGSGAEPPAPAPALEQPTATAAPETTP